MTINVSVAMLLNYDQELKSLATSILYLFHRSKINEFYNKNGIRIKTALKERDELWKEFVVIEEDGRLKTEGEGENKKLVLKEEIRRHELEEKMSALMNKQIAIEI